jgi:hypothetical protein
VQKIWSLDEVYGSTAGADARPKRTWSLDEVYPTTQEPESTGPETGLAQEPFGIGVQPDSGPNYQATDETGKPYTPLGEALVTELGNTPERVARGLEGNRLLMAENEIVAAFNQIKTLKNPAAALEQVRALKQQAELAFEAAGVDERVRLTDTIRQMGQQEDILSRIVQTPGMAETAVEAQRGRIEENQRTRAQSQSAIDAAEAEMVPTNVRPGLYPPARLST